MATWAYYRIRGKFAPGDWAGVVLDQHGTARNDGEILHIGVKYISDVSL